MAEMRIDRNSKYLAFNLGVDVGIEIYSMVDFTKLIVFSDVHPSPPWNDPIFELGSRFAVYTTTTLFDALSPQIALATRNRHGIDLESPGLYSGTTSIGHEGSLLRGIGDHAGIGQGRNMHGGGSSNGVGSGATGVYAGEIATKVAKGVASGVKVIGEYGYHAISNYFAASAATERMGGGDGRGDKGDHPRGIRTGSSFNNAVNGSDNFKEAAHGGGVSALSHDSRTERKKDVHDGVIIIRSLPSYQPPSPSPSPPLSNYNSFSTPQIAGEIGISKVISLYKPHTNPIAILMLDSSETRLYTTSVEGMSVYVWDISDIYIRNANCSSVAGHGSSSLVIPTCLFRCDRGYTAAKIESISPSFDGKWISVLTARGTAHIFHTEFGSSSATNGRDGGTTLSTKHTQPEFANSHRMVAAKVLSPIVRLNARSSINVVKDLFTQDQTMLETGASDLNETVDTKSFDNAFKAAGTQKTNCQPSQSTTTHISGDMYYSYNGHMAEFLPPMQGNASASTVSCAERQHLLVWDPSGTLTLFWLDLVPTSDLLKSTSPLPPPVLHMLSGFPHATYVRTVARRGGLGTAVLKSEYKVLTMPASKWVLARDTLWDQVWMQDRITTSIKDAYKIDAQRWLPEHQKQLWPSCIEISTCSDLRVPLWMDLQCAMQVYHPDQATKTLVSLMDDAAAASSPGGSGNRGQIGSIRPHVRPRASFSDVPLATNIVIAPYTPTPHGDRKGFPRLDGNAELEKGILSAMGDGMDMPVSQQSLLDSFFSEDDGFNVIKSAHSIPAVDLKHDGYEPHIELQATSMVTTAWGTVRRALDCSNANMVQNGVGKEVSRAFDTDTIHSTLSYGDSDDDCDMPVNAEIHATCASQDESVVPRAVASPNSVSIGVSSIVSDVCDPGITDPVNYILAMSPEETPKD
ncbi:hypothetical protein BASA62_008621 [Batrachochytrium salamandrivorans]|nr:hypothetical protein BASA62_008621 [Batrachochytrium salamandrivorans]